MVTSNLYQLHVSLTTSLRCFLTNIYFSPIGLTIVCIAPSHQMFYFPVYFCFKFKYLHFLSIKFNSHLSFSSIYRHLVNTSSEILPKNKVVTRWITTCNNQLLRLWHEISNYRCNFACIATLNTDHLRSSMNTVGFEILLHRKELITGQVLEN